MSPPFPNPSCTQLITLFVFTCSSKPLESLALLTFSHSHCARSYPWENSLSWALPGKTTEPLLLGYPRKSVHLNLSHATSNHCVILLLIFYWSYMLCPCGLLHCLFFLLSKSLPSPTSFISANDLYSVETKLFHPLPIPLPPPLPFLSHRLLLFFPSISEAHLSFSVTDELSLRI